MTFQISNFNLYIHSLIGVNKEILFGERAENLLTITSFALMFAVISLASIGFTDTIELKPSNFISSLKIFGVISIFIYIYFVMSYLPKYFKLVINDKKFMNHVDSELESFEKLPPYKSSLLWTIEDNVDSLIKSFDDKCLKLNKRRLHSFEKKILMDKIFNSVINVESKGKNLNDYMNERRETVSSYFNR